MNNLVNELAQEAVLKKTCDDRLYLKEQVRGYDWSEGVNYEKLLKTYLHSGFQATNFGLAVEEIHRMIECRNLPLSKEIFQGDEDTFACTKNNCTIFLGYTSNIVSSGLRESIKFLVQHKLVCTKCQCCISHVTFFFRR